LDGEAAAANSEKLVRVGDKCVIINPKEFSRDGRTFRSFDAGALVVVN